MLAAIIAISQSGSILSTGYNLLFLIAYLLVMFGIIRPLFRVAGKVYNNTEVISHGMVGVIFILLLPLLLHHRAAEYARPLRSLYARGSSCQRISPSARFLPTRSRTFSLMLSLPLFFVSSGLQTELGLIDSPATWVLLGLFTLVAVVGKVGGTYVSARFSGESPKSSIYLGAFMNTRGLMELVVLGYRL